MKKFVNETISVHNKKVSFDTYLFRYIRAIAKAKSRSENLYCFVEDIQNDLSLYYSAKTIMDLTEHLFIEADKLYEKLYSDCELFEETEDGTLEV